MQIQQKRDRYDKDDSEYKHHNRKQQVVKIITNAISYGIFAETATLDRNQIPVDVYGLVNFQQKKDKIERPDFMFNLQEFIYQIIEIFHLFLIYNLIMVAVFKIFKTFS